MSRQQRNRRTMISTTTIITDCVTTGLSPSVIISSCVAPVSLDHLPWLATTGALVALMLCCRAGSSRCWMGSSSHSLLDPGVPGILLLLLACTTATTDIPIQCSQLGHKPNQMWEHTHVPGWANTSFSFNKSNYGMEIELRLNQGMKLHPSLKPKYIWIRRWQLVTSQCAVSL